MKLVERRQAILRILNETDKITMDELACRLEVCKSTIKNDLLDLSLFYPIYTQSGRHHGGVYMDKSYITMHNKKKSEEIALLTRLMCSLNGKEHQIIKDIIDKVYKGGAYA